MSTTITNTYPIDSSGYLTLPREWLPAACGSTFLSGRVTLPWSRRGGWNPSPIDALDLTVVAQLDPMIETRISARGLHAGTALHIRVFQDGRPMLHHMGRVDNASATSLTISMTLDVGERDEPVTPGS